MNEEQETELRNHEVQKQRYLLNHSVFLYFVSLFFAFCSFFFVLTQLPI
jgi:hypothetical protein